MYLIQGSYDGREFETHVASSDEWANLRDSYGGVGAGATFKYKEFANGVNVGATNESGLSLMLGGAYSAASSSYGLQGDSGIYLTSTDNSNGSKKAYKVDKNNTNIITLSSFPDGNAGQVRLIIEN